MPSRSSLITMANRFFESNPAYAVQTLEAMSEEDAVNVLKALPPATAADAVTRLPDAMATDLMSKLLPTQFREIVERLAPEQGAAIFRGLPAEMRPAFLEHLSEANKRRIQELLSYPEDSAGRIMKTDFLAFHTDLKVKDAIHKIRQLANRGYPASYLYVVDKENHLAGVINMRDLMLAQSDASLETIMRKQLFSVSCFMDRENAAQELANRRFFAVPVVDFENRLLGVLKAEDLIDDVQEEATEDMQMMFGAGGDERVFSSISYALGKRLPWLHVNLATAFLAAAVVSCFEDLIARITVLAVYLPVVAGQGGNAGAQSLAIVMRGLVMREIPARKAKNLIAKETFIGLVNGVVIGLITAGVAWLWQGNPYLGLVVALGMAVNLTIAGFAGAAIPLAMKTLGLDPAQCSNIILTTVTDVMGFFSFLGFALIFQAQLL